MRSYMHCCLSSFFNSTANFLSLSKSVSSWVTPWLLNRGPGIVFGFFSRCTVCILKMFWHAWHTWWVSLWRRYCYFNIFWIHFSHWWFTYLFTLEFSVESYSVLLPPSILSVICSFPLIDFYFVISSLMSMTKILLGIVFVR